MITQPAFYGGGLIALRGGRVVKVINSKAEQARFGFKDVLTLTANGDEISVVGSRDDKFGCWLRNPTGGEWVFSSEAKPQWCCIGGHSVYSMRDLIVIDDRVSISMDAEILHISNAGDGRAVVHCNRSGERLSYVVSLSRGTIIGSLDAPLPLRNPAICGDMLVTESDEMPIIVPQWRIDDRCRRRILTDLSAQYVIEPRLAGATGVALTGGGSVSSNVADARRKICAGCDAFRSGRCQMGANGSFVDANLECPLRKWTTIMGTPHVFIVQDTPTIDECQRSLRLAGLSGNATIMSREYDAQVKLPPHVTDREILDVASKSVDKGKWVLVIKSSSSLAVDAIKKAEWLLQQQAMPSRNWIHLFTHRSEQYTAHGWKAGRSLRDDAVLFMSNSNQQLCKHWHHIPSLVTYADDSGERAALGADNRPLPLPVSNGELRVGIITERLEFDDEGETIRQMSRWWSLSEVAVRTPMIRSELQREIGGKITTPYSGEMWSRVVNRVYANSDIVICFSLGRMHTALAGVPTILVNCDTTRLDASHHDSIAVVQRPGRAGAGETRVIIPGVEMAMLKAKHADRKGSVIFGNIDRMAEIYEPTTVIGDVESASLQNPLAIAVYPHWDSYRLIPRFNALITHTPWSVHAMAAVLAGIKVVGWVPPHGTERFMTMAAHQERWENLICEIPSMSDKIDRSRENRNGIHVGSSQPDDGQSDGAECLGGVPVDDEWRARRAKAFRPQPSIWRGEPAPAHRPAYPAEPVQPYSDRRSRYAMG